MPTLPADRLAPGTRACPRRARGADRARPMGPWRAGLWRAYPRVFFKEAVFPYGYCGSSYGNALISIRYSGWYTGVAAIRVGMGVGADTQ